MMFDAKCAIEPDFIAQRELAPKLLVALMRRHAGLGPDMRKMRELHAADPSIETMARNTPQCPPTAFVRA
jgi:hypothetical protein